MPQIQPEKPQESTPGACTAVVLPGLDGTGKLLTEFAAALTPRFQVKVIDYPCHEALGYDELESFVRARLPETAHIVIGESFSGPLALRLAQNPPAGLAGVVLGASFARLDLPAKTLLSALAGRVSPRLMPVGILARLLAGRWSTPEWRSRLRQALAAVAPNVLAHRARQALAVDLLREGKPIRLPVLCLRASADSLMPASAALQAARLAPGARIRDVEAPHFLFQAAPDECAALIFDFWRGISAASGADAVDGSHA